MANFGLMHALPGKLARLRESVIHKLPHAYFGTVALVACIGYAFVLLLPVSVLAGILNIYHELAFKDVINWQYLAIWLAIVCIAGLASYRMTQIKPVSPAGLTLTEAKAPELFKLVQQLHSHFKRPAIQRIVVTGLYELDIVKTPRWALPVWSTNTMVIGLPVLQSLSPKQFECMVTRRMGQFSKRDNPLTNWLYQLRTIWQQYRVLYAKQKRLGSEPLKWFFAVYAPFYSAISVYAARQDELHADTYAMELFNDEEVRDMATADSVCRWYLQNQYWPAVYKIASIETKSLPTPHAKMATAIHASLKAERLQALLDKVINEEPDYKNARPSLQQRLKNIGHDEACLQEQMTENAATYYLGASTEGVIAIIDKLWLQAFLQKRKQQHPKAKNKPLPEQVTSV